MKQKSQQHRARHGRIAGTRQPRLRPPQGMQHREQNAFRDAQGPPTSQQCTPKMCQRIIEAPAVGTGCSIGRFLARTASARADPLSTPTSSPASARAAVEAAVDARGCASPPPPQTPQSNTETCAGALGTLPLRLYVGHCLRGRQRQRVRRPRLRGRGSHQWGTPACNDFARATRHLQRLSPNNQLGAPVRASDTTPCVG